MIIVYYCDVTIYEERGSGEPYEHFTPRFERYLDGGDNLSKILDRCRELKKQGKRFITHVRVDD